MFEHLQREKADKKRCFQPPVLFGGDLQRFLEKVINHGKLLLLVSGDEEKKSITSSSCVLKRAILEMCPL